MSDDIPSVTNNHAAGQFELRSEHGTSLLRYQLAGDVLDLVHTEVPAALQGRGVGKTLVVAAIQYAREQRMHILPTCPFVRHYVDRHPEIASLLAVPPAPDA